MRKARSGCLQRGHFPGCALDALDCDEGDESCTEEQQEVNESEDENAEEDNDEEA